MMERCPHPARPRSAVTAVRSGICDRFLFGLALLTLVRAGEALAGEAGSSGAARAELEFRPGTALSTSSEALSPAPFGAGLSAPSGAAFYAPSGTLHPALSGAEISTPGFADVIRQPYTSHLLSDQLHVAPRAYRLDAMPEIPAFSARDFRPRGRSMFDTPARLGGPEDNLSFNKNTWQRLNEYRTRDRVRVLTLWESGVSAISIQTDRKGDPWLQWTSSLMNRGGASHGVLDQLFPTSLFGGTTPVTRSPSAQPSRITGALSALHIGGTPPP
jgi:hypothetical protein